MIAIGLVCALAAATTEQSIAASRNSATASRSLADTVAMKSCGVNASPRASSFLCGSSDQADNSKAAPNVNRIEAADRARVLLIPGNRNALESMALQTHRWLD